MDHKTDIREYEGEMLELCEDIGNLRYDALRELLCMLALKLSKDGNKDSSRKRMKLAHALWAASDKIKDASFFINQAWEISAPHMGLDADGNPKSD